MGVDCLIYFDNAATSYPKPKLVLKAVNEAIVKYGGNPGRSGHLLSYNTAEKIYSVRKSYADFFGIKTENVVFCSNCTHALNMAIKGIAEAGCHIITTNLEHNSVIRPLKSLENNKRITFDIVKIYDDNDDLTLKQVETRITEKTKAIIATAASNVTGAVLPIKKIGKLCRKRGIYFIVDAAQSAGVLPINLEECCIDILCTAGHKSLFGITGTGLMLVNTKRLISTIIEGGTGSVSVEETQPIFLPDRFESGTINTVGILSLDAGLRFIKNQGIDNIYEHELSLCKRLYEDLASDKRFKLYGAGIKKDRNVPIVTFNIKGISSTEAVVLLSNMGFALRGGLHCAPNAHKSIGTIENGAIRFSPGVYNKDAEVKLFVNTLYKIAKDI